MRSDPIQVDVAIVGGGVAGLWLLHRLRATGFSAVLLENRALGAGQTIASQGIIHGGTKYALTNRLTGASEAIAAMPALWRACLEGRGEIDLRGTRVLSPCQQLWSSGPLASRATTFFAAKSMRGRVEALPRDRYPPAFAHEAFHGSVYRLDEIVVDVPSLLRNLAAAHADRLLRVGAGMQDVTVDVDRSSRGGVTLRLARPGLSAATPDPTCGDENGMAIRAQALVCTAGEGNEAWLARLGFAEPRAQRRPLHMVLVRGELPFDMYGHCLGTGPTPRLTITTHPAPAPAALGTDFVHTDAALDERIWYLGGEIAESGIKRPLADQLAFARRELEAVFPWVNFSYARWDSFHIDRAEPAQSGGRRPDGPFIAARSPCFVAWPTKLAFAPRLVADLLDRLVHDAKITPGECEPQGFGDWPRAAVALAPWEEARTWTVVD